MFDARMMVWLFVIGEGRERGLKGGGMDGVSLAGGEGKTGRSKGIEEIKGKRGWMRRSRVRDLK